MPRTSVKAVANRALAAEKRAVKAQNKLLTEVPTTDSFQNFQAALGIGTSSISSGSTYGFNPITRNRILCEWIYRGSWLGGVAVDCIADDMTRAGITINSTSTPKDNEKLIKKMRPGLADMGDVVRWARLYGGAIGVFMVDGQDPRTPLRLETVGKGQFKGIQVYDRWMCEPSLNDLVTDLGPRRGEPKFYRVTADAPVLRNEIIHYSRVFRAVGVKLPYWQSLMENLWGISILERFYDRLVAFDSTTQGASQLVYRAYLRTLKVDKFREIMATSGKAQAGLVNSIAFMRQMQTNEGMTTIDTKDELETHQYSFGGLSDVMLRFSEQCCGSIGTVMARLFGQSPSGLNSAGDHELRTYYDTINQRQERDMREPVMALSQLTARSENIALPEDFDFVFTDLWQLTAKEKQDIATSNEQSVSEAVSGGLIRRVTGLKELRTSSRITGVFTNITDEDIVEAEEEPMPGEAALGPEGEPLVPGQPGAQPGAEPSPRPAAAKKLNGRDPLREKPETQDSGMHVHIHREAPGEGDAAIDPRFSWTEGDMVPIIDEIPDDAHVIDVNIG